MPSRATIAAVLATLVMAGCATADRLPAHQVQITAYSRAALNLFAADDLSPVAITRDGTRLAGGLTIWRDRICSLQQGYCAPEAEVVTLERRLLTGDPPDPNATRPQEVAAYVVFAPLVLTAIVLSEAGLWTPYPEHSPEERQRRDTQHWREQAERLVAGCAFHAPQEIASLRAVLATDFAAPGAVEEQALTQTGTALAARWQTLGPSCLGLLGIGSHSRGITIPREALALLQIRRRHLALMCGEGDRPLSAPGAPPAAGAVEIIRFDSLMAGFSQYSMDSRAWYFEQTAAILDRWLADPVTFNYVPETTVACPSATNPMSNAEAQARIAASHPLHGWRGQDYARSLLAGQ